MSKLQIGLLKKITRKIVVQGFRHKCNIILYCGILIDAARQEFTEDNKPMLDAFLRECFDEALN